MTHRLKGLIAAPFTAMKSDASINLEIIESQAALLADNKVHGAFVCGTTGEGVALTVDERMQVAERWMAVAPPQLRIIVHVAHNSLGESRRLAAHAQSIGASATASIGPTFFRPSSVEQLVDYCVPTAAAAPSSSAASARMPLGRADAVARLAALEHEVRRLRGERLLDPQQGALQARIEVLEIPRHEEVQPIAVAHDADLAAHVVELGSVDLEREVARDRIPHRTLHDGVQGGVQVRVDLFLLAATDEAGEEQDG